MTRRNNPVDTCWGLLTSTSNRVSPHSIGVGVLGLLGLLRRPQHPNTPPTYLVEWGRTYRGAHGVRAIR